MLVVSYTQILFRTTLELRDIGCIHQDEILEYAIKALSYPIEL